MTHYAACNPMATPPERDTIGDELMAVYVGAIRICI